MADRAVLPRIAAAAIKVGRATLSIPAPARHHDVLRVIHDLGLDAAIIGQPGSQGFLTSDGQFLGRSAALQLAIDNGQLDLDKWSGRSAHLFSEDLW